MNGDDAGKDERGTQHTDAPAAVIQTREHLTPDAPKSRHTARPDAPNEALCLSCRSRVTVGPDGTEYGHAYSCPARPGSLPDSADGGNTKRQVRNAQSD